MIDDFTELNRHYRQAIAQVPFSSFYHELINHKYRHSVSVWQIGKEILQSSPELQNCSEEFRLYAERALLFHDIGRFNEGVRRYQAEQNNILDTDVSGLYDHCEIGYNLLKDNPKYNDMRILFAIRYHGKMMEDVKATKMWQEIQNYPHKDDIVKILYLVRDADKMANLQVIKANDHLRQDPFYRQLTQETLVAPISPQVMEQFCARQTIRFATICSFADRIMLVISWIYDLNYTYTKQAFHQQGFDKYLFDLLSQYHHGQTELNFVRTALNL